MTVTTTPTFGLPYPEDNEPIAHLPDILQQQAEGIEKALTRFDFNGTDANRYAARLAAVYISITEISSILENLGEINPEIANSPLLQLFRSAKNTNDNDEDGKS